jgi:hypothetical protein
MAAKTQRIEPKYTEIAHYAKGEHSYVAFIVCRPALEVSLDADYNVVCRSYSN